MEGQSVTAAQAQLAQHRTTAVYIVVAVFLGTAWLAVALRMWVRAWMIKSFGPDDWAMVFTIVAGKDSNMQAASRSSSELLASCAICVQLCAQYYTSLLPGSRVFSDLGGD